MRILQVCAVDFTAYYFLGPLMRGLRRAGWHVEFACADGPFAARLRAEGFTHRALPLSRSISPLNNGRALLELAGTLRSRHVDVVHTHTPVGGIVGRGAAALSACRTVVHTFHGLPFTAHRLEPLERAFLAAERLVAPRTTWWFSQARADADRAVELGIARRGRVTVIGNGVDVERFRPDAEDRVAVRDAFGIGEAEPVLIVVARLVREKGILDLADALLRLRAPSRLRVLVVGDALPSDRTSIVRELAVHPVAKSSHVIWERLGHRDDVERVLRAADLFVLPSHREGLPRSVIEALASGLPVVATDIPGCRELVDGGLGRLVPVGAPHALAEAIGALIADRSALLQMGSAARQRALERHDESRIVEAQVELLRSLAA